MKTLAIIFTLALMNIASFASNKYDNYVITAKDTFFCSKIQVANEDLICTVNQGNKLIINSNLVISYKINGEIYERKNVIENGQETSNADFMQLVRQNKNFRVYRVPKDASFSLGSEEYNYYVYENGSFKCKITEKNVESINQFFHSF